MRRILNFIKVSIEIMAGLSLLIFAATLMFLAAAYVFEGDKTFEIAVLVSLALLIVQGGATSCKLDELRNDLEIRNETKKEP